jgi:hypothetical protein
MTLQFFLIYTFAALISGASGQVPTGGAGRMAMLFLRLRHIPKGRRELYGMVAALPPLA